MEGPLSVEETRIYEQRLRSMLASNAEVVERIEPEAQLEEDLDLLAAGDDLGYEAREALERIAGDTFGLCEACGAWLGRQRLALLPYARLCVGCAQAPKGVWIPTKDATEELCS